MTDSSVTRSDSSGDLYDYNMHNLPPPSMPPPMPPPRRGRPIDDPNRQRALAAGSSPRNLARIWQAFQAFEYNMHNMPPPSMPPPMPPPRRARGRPIDPNSKRQRALAAGRSARWRPAAAPSRRWSEATCSALSDLLGLEEDEEVIYIVEDVD